MSDTTHTLSDFVGHRKTFRNNQPTLAFPELSWKNMSGVTLCITHLQQQLSLPCKVSLTHSLSGGL